MLELKNQSIGQMKSIKYHGIILKLHIVFYISMPFKKKKKKKKKKKNVQEIENNKMDRYLPSHIHFVKRLNQ